MTRPFHMILGAAAILGIATQVAADPISTNNKQCYRAAWVPAKEIDCDQVCRKVKMSAESMLLSAASAQKIFVCRHAGEHQNFFGMQVSQNCQVVDSGGARKQAKYECLCVLSGCGPWPSK